MRAFTPSLSQIVDVASESVLPSAKRRRAQQMHREIAVAGVKPRRLAKLPHRLQQRKVSPFTPQPRSR